MSYYDIKATFRPIDVWPGVPTAERKASPFRAGWGDTLELLKRELRALGADRVVIQVDMPESMIRLDGYPRADARPRSPGVIVAFEATRIGQSLRYPCDRFTDWRDNVRAIALALEALRKVDRYGVTRRGEQYAGWKALPAGETTHGLVQRGRALIEQHGSVRAALRVTHPDAGGNPDDFRAVVAARDAS